MTAILLNTGTCSVTYYMICLGRWFHSCALHGNVHSAVTGWCSTRISHGRLIILFESSLFMWYSINHQEWSPEASICYCWTVYFSFESRCCFMNLEGDYECTYICNCYRFLCVDPFIVTKHLSVSTKSLVLGPMLLLFNTATPALWLLFAWFIFFCPFSFNLLVSLNLKCISRTQRIAESDF